MKNPEKFIIPLTLVIAAILVAVGITVVISAKNNSNKIDPTMQLAQGDTQLPGSPSNVNDQLAQQNAAAAQRAMLTNQPVITSITPTSGPVGTVVTITGRNLAGFEGDLDANIRNGAGENAFLLGIGSVPRADGTIRVQINNQLCRQNNSYSGAPCASYMNIVPGVYNIYTEPWGKSSNLVPFTVTTSDSVNIAPVDTTTDWQTYSNPEYGISFQYPVGSKVSDIDITGGRELDINNIDGTMTSIRIQDSRLVPNYSPIQTPCNDNGYYTSGTLDTYNDIDFVKSDVSNTYGGMQSDAYAESYCVVNGGTNYTITPRISWSRYSGGERGGNGQNTTQTIPPDKTTSFDTFDQVMSDLEFTFTN